MKEKIEIIAGDKLEIKITVENNVRIIDYDLLSNSDVIEIVNEMKLELREQKFKRICKWK